MSRNRRARRRRQSGTVLAIALILLLLLSVVAISSARLALQAQRAVASDYDHEVAFRAADAALADAERMFSLPDSDRFFAASEVAEPDRERWREFDLINDPARQLTEFGARTGRQLAYGDGILPRQLPRYLVEQLQPARAASATSIWRATAIGFGAHDEVYVVLQAIFRRDAVNHAVRRLSWREIGNWDELHAQALGSQT